jgi:hypothetical protein
VGKKNEKLNGGLNKDEVKIIYSKDLTRSGNFVRSYMSAASLGEVSWSGFWSQFHFPVTVVLRSRSISYNTSCRRTTNDPPKNIGGKLPGVESGCQ